jgi:CheY-like chemotaxis protein
MQQKNTFRVIIADDDLDDQFFLKQAIEQLNPAHSIISAYNGLELLDLLFKQKEKPDAIILDLNMPLLDGFGALKKIKAEEETRPIPVFILSTTHFDYDIKKSRELGAEDFYCKPYQYAKLKGIVEDIFLRAFASKT